MRLLDRLRTWLRATPAGPELADIPTALDSDWRRRLPNASADVFRHRFRQALQQVVIDRRASAFVLDNSVQVLFSRRSTDEDATRAQMDAALRDIESDGRDWVSITWTALSDVRPTFQPAPMVWAGDDAGHFDGDTGMVFFLDMAAITVAMAHAAEAVGVRVRMGDDQDMFFGDGVFETQVNLRAVVAEALWTGAGPMAVVQRRAHGLLAELRSCHALCAGLRRRFPHCRFDVANDAPGRLFAFSAAGGTLEVDYRHLAAAMRHEQKSVDAWLSRVVFADLFHLQAVTLVARAPSFIRAYPDALVAPAEGVLIAAHHEVDGRLVPVRRTDADPAHRLDHYRAEASRQLPTLTFQAHGFVLESAGHRGFGLVGDKVATSLLHPAVLAGVAYSTGLFADTVMGRAVAENIVLLSNYDNDEFWSQLRTLGLQLETALGDEPSDALSFTHRLDLSDPAAFRGTLDWDLVLPAFFLHWHDSLLSHEPGLADYHRGVAFESLGRLEQARTCLERAARLRRFDGTAQLALGRVLSSAGEVDRALDVLPRAVQLLPDEADAQGALGVALHRAGRVEDAVKALQQAVLLAPDNASSWINLGRACCDNVAYDDARQALERALRLSPSSSDAHASLAVLHHRRGDRPRALHHARQALSEQSDDQTVQELLKLLESDDH